jgi:hypothetical protein
MLSLTVSALAGELSVVLVQPALNSSNVSVNASIHVDFNMPLDRSTITPENFWAFARWSGAVNGTIDFANNDQTLTLSHSQPFSHGEQVTVFLSHNILADDGSPLRAAGYSWQFTTRVRPTPMTFSTITSLSTPRVSGTKSATSFPGGIVIGSCLFHSGFGHEECHFRPWRHCHWVVPLPLGFRV